MRMRQKVSVKFRVLATSANRAPCAYATMAPPWQLYVSHRLWSLNTLYKVMLRCLLLSACAQRFGGWRCKNVANRCTGIFRLVVRWFFHACVKFKKLLKNYSIFLPHQLTLFPLIIIFQVIKKIYWNVVQRMQTSKSTGNSEKPCTCKH